MKEPADRHSLLLPAAIIVIKQGCVRGQHGRGQGQIILDQGHVCLYNPT